MTLAILFNDTQELRPSSLDNDLRIAGLPAVGTSRTVLSYQEIPEACLRNDYHTTTISP